MLHAFPTSAVISGVGLSCAGGNEILECRTHADSPSVEGNAAAAVIRTLPRVLAPVFAAFTPKKQAFVGNLRRAAAHWMNVPTARNDNH
jgi:hypothetical protein